MHLQRIHRRHFIRDLVLVFLLLSAAVLGAVIVFSSRAREHISQTYIDNAVAGAVREFAAMVNSMTRTLELAADGIASGRLSLTNADERNGLLFPLLTRDRTLFGVSVADTAGSSYYLTAHGDGWRTSQVGTDGLRRESVVRDWNADRQPISQEVKPSTYDPRSRPWFAPALSADEVFWTRPYTFYERRVAGITASIAREAASGNGQIVVAFDILMDDLFHEIQRMAPSENSRVFVFRNDAQIYMPGDGEEASAFRAMVEVQDPLIRQMAAAWEASRLPSTEAVKVAHDNQTWWCGFQPMESANPATSG